MKFINYLESISGISVYGLASLLIFGVFFILVLIWSIKADKNMIDEISRIPLDNRN
ncbi:CcoQ/FixQ family Cbb3-type cytochrome c oxidase assembly chaperone [Flavihumibacter sp. RY-1]|uniref:CcoQ/FixQ family Cbb3-type cytochrome c oxidase assembly chaperone n=1 Tax=Flavihumibacter fluminis TaxID=2909236 RepID=A0ABS9BES8_9BACT|nr:CcoQ/FixQ family Cbb3-type cytochrome c oxidase assembly chaperone [Flavihumibacter fluminis]MCF1714222.1 CcoQ/FixQ family Cbb3-type cytochrome c oxidase assembly chaperone [Flavihumibacter fluminis]